MLFGMSAVRKERERRANGEKEEDKERDPSGEKPEHHLGPLSGHLASS